VTEAFLGPFQRWTMQAGALFIVGIAAWRWIVWPRSVLMVSEGARLGEVGRRSDETLSSVAGMGCTAATVLLGAWLLAFLVNILGFRDPFVPLREDAVFLLTRTFWGRVWMVQGILAVGLVSVFASLAQSRARVPDCEGSDTLAARRSPGWATATSLAIALPVTMALSSHAMSVSGDGRLIAVGADSVHILAAGTWIGSLTVILLLGYQSEYEPPFIASQLRAFSPMALVAVPLLVLMGGTLGLQHVPTIQDLWEAPYGRVLVGKVLLAGVVLFVGFVNWRRGLPVLDSHTGLRSVRRRAAFEVGLAGVVLGFTAALTGMTTP
jgi:putative copper resistance protein D